MKKILTVYFILVNGLIYSQLIVSNNLTPQQMVQNILAGSGVTISNVTYVGELQQIGTFNGVNSNIGFNSGLILTTGDIVNAVGPNNTDAAGTGLGNPGDNDLDQIIFDGTNDACVLEFDFVPVSDTVVFNYVFASEEYMEWVNSGVNDGFGFFISGPGINGPFSNNSENIALIPGTAQFVTIDDVNANSNSQFYVDNENPPGQSIQYDGFTIPLQAISRVQCGEIYHLKIVIADGGDDVYDSGVFLQAGSLISTGINIDLATVTGDTIIYEECTEAQFIFTRPESMLNEVMTINYVLSGTATEGVDYPNLPGFVEFAIGEDSVIVSLIAFQDGILEGNETVTISASYVSQCGDLITIEKTLTISEQPIFNAIVNSPEVFCPSDTVDMIVQAIGGTPPYIYTWSNGETGDTVNGSINGLGTETYIVDILDFCGYTFQSSVTITQSPPPPLDLDLFANIVGCNDLLVDMFAFEIGGVFPVTLTWSNGAIGNFVQGATDVQSYTVTATDACNNVYAEDLILEFEELIPMVVNATAPLATCIDETVLLTANTIGGNFPFSFSWDNGGFGESVQGLVAGLPTYTVTVTDNCGQVETASVTIELAPDPTVTLIAPDILIQCPDSTIDLTATASGGFEPYTYTWDGGLGTGSTVVASALTNGTQIFNVIVSDFCGNLANTTVDLTLNQTLAISNTSQTTSVNCLPTGTTDASVTGETGNVNYVWNGPGVNGPIVSNIQTAQNLATGWYYLTVTDAVCVAFDSVFVEVLPPVIAEFSANETIGSLPLDVAFTNLSQNADSFDWNFGNGLSEFGTDISNQNTTYLFSDIFTVQLIAYQGPCSDTAELIITVLSKPSVVEANIFTPNGDQTNDGFTLNPRNFKNFYFIILNRWGNVMFEGDLLNSSWNGILTNGDEASEGTYFYEYSGIGLNDEILSGHGSFQLVRK
jgi:gliding motility-associated-like protein